MVDDLETGPLAAVDVDASRGPLDGRIVVLDGAPYFQASAVTDLSARGDFAFITLATYSPELNPVEECWRQLQRALSNRFFDPLDELTTAIDTALDRFSITEMSNYF